MKKHYSRQSALLVIFLCILFSLAVGIFAVINGNALLGYTEIAFGAVLVVYYIIVNKNKARDMAEYIGMITSAGTGMAQDAISRFPLAMAVLSIDGQIMWYNDMFSDLVGNSDLYSIVLPSIMPDLRWPEILKSVEKIDVHVTYNERKYNVVGNIIKSKDVSDDNGNPVYSVLLYFIDRTEIEALEKKYLAEQTDVAIITIDNYDEIFQKMDDIQYQETLSKINGHISRWVAESKGVTKKTERDRYIMLFEHQYLQHYIKINLTCWTRSAPLERK